MKAKFPPYGPGDVAVVNPQPGETYRDAIDRITREVAGTPTHDPVTKPAHYQRGGIETIDYIRATLGDEGFIAYAIGNSLKYLSRFRDKDGVQDLKKAQVYLGWAIKTMEKTP